VLAAAVDAVRPAARARDIELVVRIKPLRLEVIGDPDRLQQVVWNLLANAVKFTPRGGRVELTAEEPGNAEQVRVRDTGMGIDPALQPYIFERFRQADSSSTRAHGGLGLGLSIVRHLVDLHGGSVSVESEGKNCGSTFTVTLPASPRRVSSVVPVLDASASRGTLDGVRVLAVDDDPDARELTLLALQAAGASVVAVASVDDALQALQGPATDVVVADIAMPYRDGYDLLREVRDRFDVPPPVIAVTAYASAEDLERSTAAGFARHLVKPIDHGLLVRTVADCARRGGSAPH
jgi:CheY-like chemotaxis protein/anti-sigma regulatory factor (Ser/Thr protein kinase)